MNSFYLVIFYLFVAVTVGSALYIVFSKNVIHSAFALLVSLLGVAGIYVFLKAEFLAVVQLVIYIGGVLLLLLFGVMLTNRLAGDKFLVSTSKNIVLGALAGISLLVIVMTVVYTTDFEHKIGWINQGNTFEGSNLKAIGAKITTSHVLPFEVSALILLVALMGAAFIAAVMINRKREHK